jgi:ABC-type transporter Mla subunit MlaD
MTEPRATEPWETMHTDISLLSQRQQANEQAISNISAQVARFAKDTSDAIDRLSDKIEQQNTTLNDKLEKQNSKYVDARGTNWYAFISASVAIITVVGGFLWIGREPIDNDLRRHEATINRIEQDYIHDTEFRRVMGRVGEDIKNDVTKDTFSELKAHLDQQDKEEHDEVVANTTRIEKRLDTLDGQLVKRPEIESSLKSLSDQLNSLQKQFTDTQTALVLAATNSANAATATAAAASAITGHK